MLKIALVHKDISTRVNKGGVSRLYVELAKELVQKGHAVTLIARSGTPIDIPNVQCIVVRACDSIQEYNWEVCRIIQESSFDICECSSWEYELLQSLTSIDKNSRPTVIVRSEFCCGEICNDETMVKNEKELLELADGIIYVSKYCQKNIEKNYKIKRGIVIWNGVTLLKENFKESDISGGVISTGKYYLRKNVDEIIKDLSNLPSKKILWIGKPTWMKGWDVFTEIVRKTPQHIFIAVIGYADEECSLTLGSFDNLIILQGLTDSALEALYEVSNFFLCTSRIEGFCLSLVEALAHRLVALAPYSLEVVHEYHSNFKNLLLYKAIDEAINMMATVEYKVENKDCLLDLTWRNCANQTIQYYMEIKSNS